jgi:outer membrane protein assembly factor BamD
MYFCAMLKIKFLRYITLAISILLILSCSHYERILKSTDYEYKYKKALEFYNKKDYTKAIGIFEQIVVVFRGTTKGDSVMYYYAKSYYGDEDYIMAGNYFSEFSENFARSPFVEESDYLIGYCYYLMSPRPSLDQENTRLSIQAFQKFLYKHPESKYIPECKRLIEELNNKFAEKAYLNSKLYFNLGYYKAAIISLRNCLNDYPDNKYREELMFLILRSNYLLAENSIPEKRKERYQSTLDEYYSFAAEFPTSKYNKDIEKIYTNTKQVLGL